MKRSALAVFAILVCIIGGGCSTSTNGKSDAPADPFAGFFAHPGSGMLELKPGEGGGKYQGSMWADFGPFPVELTREGNVARGTVTYGGARHPLQVESTPQGLALTVDGIRAEAPLLRYTDMKAYKKWYESRPGYQGTVVEKIEPSPRPAR